MGGICGFFGQVQNPRKNIERMSEIMSHRGGAKMLRKDGGLCFAQLSNRGRDVAVSDSGELVLVYDGRLYNRGELAAELKSDGHTFSEESDAQVILHGYEQWGEDLLTKLRGMFAFAIYNENDKSLFMARDHFGIKPLYYTTINRNFVFASEIKGIMKFSGFERRLNTEALDSYLSFGFVVPPETFFEDVYALLPGHFLWYKNGEVAADRYFEPRFKPDDRLTEEDAVGKISEVMKDSVTAHKTSGVEVGCLLSGGVDSGYLSTFFKDHKTFTISFADDQEHSEADAAKEISDEVGADHYTGIVTQGAFWKSIPVVQKLLDQPMADPSAIAMYFTSALAAKYVQVAVSGEGADELFGGYEAYKAPYRFRNYHKVPYGLRKFLCKIVSPFPDSKARDFIIKGTHPLEDEFVGSSYLCTNEEKWAVLKDNEFATRAQATTKRIYHRVRKEDGLTKMQYLDMSMGLSGDLLQRADRMSMAHSLELRLPYLDKEVFKVASSLPSELRVNKQGTKYALRQAAAKSLTEDLTGKKSAGYSIPLSQWLAEDSVYDLVKEEFRTPTAQKYFNIDVLLSFLDDHYVGEADYSRQIWAVYAFLVWYRQYFEEITTEEITEDAIAEVEAIAEVATEEVAESSMGEVDSKKLDELFGLAFDDGDDSSEETEDNNEEN
ncbi:MAG: asparagine synthase (glutamine-hydrolyzing) [Clostridia bacterium]|nr:asparagine synthase (glutamine-hydrolyzing) [Clostridia bacterium]